MKQNRWIVLLCTMMLCALLLTACNPPASPEESLLSQPVSLEPEQSAEEPVGQPSSVGVLDMTGRVVTVDQPVERIVVLSAADCELIYALGAGDRVVGRGEYCDYPAEALEVPAVQSGYETNLEQIVALEPDLVVMTKMSHSIEMVENLSRMGYPVFLTNAQSIVDIDSDIYLLGKLLDCREEAQELIMDFQVALQELGGRVPSLPEKQTVYFEVSPLEHGLWTAGRGTFMDEIAQLLGLENIFSDVEGWGEISQEQVLARNPDHIVTVTMYFGEGLLPEEEILTREGWQELTAVKNGNVIPAKYDEITRPGLRLVEAAEDLYQHIYGES